MAKEQFQRNKLHVNVGTIGHVDHGKTTLAHRHTSGTPWSKKHDLWSENAAELRIRTSQTTELQRESERQ